MQTSPDLFRTVCFLLFCEAMKYLYCVFIAIAFSFGHAKAQVQVSFNIGDSLTLGPCQEGENFNHIDILVKTRWPNPEATYDTLSGKGFYNWYFDGDIDSKRLPCQYSGRRFKIAGFHIYQNEDGTQRTVIFGRFRDEATVLWIEAEKAVESGEVIP